MTSYRLTMALSSKEKLPPLLSFGLLARRAVFPVFVAPARLELVLQRLAYTKRYGSRIARRSRLLQIQQAHATALLSHYLARL